MIDLLELEKQLISPHLKKGGVCVDFTMGNGHDTLFLANAVGEEGHVYAFDVQSQAVEHTRARLTEAGVIDRCTLILDSHHTVKNYVKGPICAGMFNLGFLPGADKSLTTLRQTTMEAVQAAMELLEPDGGLLIAVYPGHEEGRLEGEMLAEFFEKENRYHYCASRFQILNSPTSPFFFLIERSPRYKENI